jgi:hypothetical protein
VLSQDGFNRKVMARTMRSVQIGTMSVNVDPINRIIICMHDSTKENDCLQYIKLQDAQQLMDLKIAIDDYFRGDL